MTKKIDMIESKLLKAIKRIDDLEENLISGELEGSLVDDLHYVIQINKKQQIYINRSRKNLEDIKNDYNDIVRFCQKIGVWEQFTTEKQKEFDRQTEIMRKLQEKNKEGNNNGEKENSEKENKNSTNKQNKS